MWRADRYGCGVVVPKGTTLQYQTFENRNAFLDACFKLLAGFEGKIPRIYSDHVGIPTLGVGYALLIKSGGSMTMRPNWRPELEESGIEIDASCYAVLRGQLSAAVGLLNASNIQAAKSIFLEWQPGEDAAAQNSAPLSLLSDTQMQALFEKTLPHYESLLKRRLGQELPDSREKLALLSLCFNSPTLIGPGLRAAVEKGDRAEAWFQIRHFSNAKKESGIAKRRFLEAQTFGLFADPAKPTEKERADAQAMWANRQKKIETYEPQFEAMIAAANRDYQLEPHELVHSLNDALKPLLA